MWPTKIIWTLAFVLLLKDSEAWSSDWETGVEAKYRVKQPRQSYGRMSLQDFRRKRQSALLYEESKALGSDLVLSSAEVEANKIIMLAKTDEFEEGFKSPRRFAPGKHLFEVLDKIEGSKLFKIISAMPKGGVLHTHGTAMGSTDTLIELTYRDNLWACNALKGLKIIGFEYCSKGPTNKLKESCTWTKMSDLRKSMGKDKVDKHLRDRLSLYPKTQYQDNNEVWRDFENIFSLLSGLLHYAPARKDYFLSALKEFHDDGVQYVEIRTSISILYDLDGKVYTPEDTLRLYETSLSEFMKANPSFCGCKLIVSPYRRKSDAKLKDYINTYYEMSKKFPNLIAGFDLVGQEEMGRPLKEMAPLLLEMFNNGVKFYFHAGETNWYGSSVDENLFDAIMLGTKRIGHGYAITKHPHVLKLIKEQNIAVELNLLSNQVLELVKDLRNHPAAYLFSDNYPVVVASDDPSFWKAKPLTHDFYVAFLGIASSRADLKFLKKLALNSIQYSAMNVHEKSAALDKWQLEWDKFIQNVINQYK